MIDCIVFNDVFDKISVISRRPAHLSMLSWISFNQYSAQCSLQASKLSHITIVETTDSAERGMNPVAMTIINPRREYWPSRGSNQRPPFLKSATLPTELWGSAKKDKQMFLRMVNMDLGHDSQRPKSRSVLPVTVKRFILGCNNKI